LNPKKIDKFNRFIKGRTDVKKYPAGMMMSYQAIVRFRYHLNRDPTNTEISKEIGVAKSIVTRHIQLLIAAKLIKRLPKSKRNKMAGKLYEVM